MRRVLITLLLLLAALVPVGIVVAGDSTDPGRPEWVDSQGVVDEEKVPAFVGVAGPDGSAVVCANGKQLKVKKEDLFGPPPAPPGRQAESEDSDFVWRCGNGKNPHLNARRVPRAEDSAEQNGG